MNREERHRERVRRQRKRRHIILLVIFISVLLATGVIAAVFYFSTDVYGDEEQFIEYVDTRLKQEGCFDTKEGMKVDYQYGSPISYAVDYDTCDNQFIESFRIDKIEKLKSDFGKTKEKEEAERAAEHSGDRWYKPPQQALIISSAVYEAGSGVNSLVIYESQNSEKDKKMAPVSSSVYTYQFSDKTGAVLVPQQIFKEDYKQRCSEYFTSYFKENYNKEELSDKWMDYVTASEDNFNKYIITDTGATFFFDEGTVLDKSQGLVYAGISYSEMGGALREHIKERYIDPDKPMVALTYDDGPGGKSETRILNCLRKNGGVATFFYLGSRISSDPENVKAAYELGCELGNHTWSHPILTSLKDEQIKSQLESTSNAIKNVCGEYPTLFRPSYGATNDKINKMSGMPVIMWSVDTLDWKHRDGKKVFDYVTSIPVLDGKIILMHSIYDSTADATERLVPWLKSKGYQMVTVSELYKYKKDTQLQKGNVYR